MKWQRRFQHLNNKAPEVLTTPGASFLGSGGGIRTPDLRVMRADSEAGDLSMF